MASEQRRLVTQTGHVILLAVCIILGSIMTLGMGSLSLTTATAPSSQASDNYDAHLLTTASTFTHYLYFPIVLSRM